MLQSLDPELMPPPELFVRRAKGLAIVEAILSPAWEWRYHSFNAAWGPGEQMASMRNGMGDEWFAVITANGIGLKGLWHESPVFRPGEPQGWMFQGLPEDLRGPLVEQAAFDASNTTFCLWSLPDGSWESSATEEELGEEDDGSAELLASIRWSAREYARWLGEYFETPVDVEAVKSLLLGEPLTEELVRTLNKDVDLDAVRAEATEIAYVLG